MATTRRMGDIEMVPGFSNLLDCLLPSYCILCGQYSGNDRLCRPCSEELPRPEPSCRQCALPGLHSDSMLCGSCLHRPPAWNEALAALVYEYPVDQLVQRFKFQRSLACGQLLAEEMTDHVLRSGASMPDALIPVPLHFTRRFWRGFNQAEFLSRQMGSRFEIPVMVHLLRRTKRTLAQSGLDRKARRKNIRGAFYCRPLAQANVALVDDVLTTGTTLTECAKAVRAAGASKVSVWVAARVPGVIALSGR